MAPGDSLTVSAAAEKLVWRDLTQMSRYQIFIENTLTWPWLLASLFLAWHGHYLWALPFSAFFFLAGLRQSHNGFHNTLGVGKALTEATLFINSLLMASSIHAIKFNHLRHHKHCLAEDDYEGRAARFSGWQAVFYGPVHAYHIHHNALVNGGRAYRLVSLAEMAAVAACLIFAAASGWRWLQYHFAAMIMGEFLMAFFAVWAVHRGTAENPRIALTQRRRWKNFITMNMFYHREHHLFPKVSTMNLPILASRIDAAYPEMAKKIAF